MCVFWGSSHTEPQEVAMDVYLEVQDTYNWLYVGDGV